MPGRVELAPVVVVLDERLDLAFEVAGKRSLVARLPWAHRTRLQRLLLILLTTNVSNKSGNLLFAPQKLRGFKFKLQELGQLEIPAWQLST